MKIKLYAFVLGVALGTSVLVPHQAGALTISDLQAQIQSLLARVNTLTEQLNVLQGQGTGSASAVSSGSTGSVASLTQHRVCKMIARNLWRGVFGDDVRSLQEFLRERGFFSAEATGFFGPITEAAVARWQAAEGIETAGAFGPISRERLRKWCGVPGQGLPGQGGSGNTERFSAEPRRGMAPLTVAFKTNVQLANSNMIADAGDYKVVFGDGNEYVFPCTGSGAFCAGPHSVEHTYMTNGTYTATLVHFGYFGVVGAPERVVGSATIRVGDIACTEEYRPVCGAKPIACVTTPCNPILMTYGNSCKMRADGATFLYDGVCRMTTVDPGADRMCKSWYDGCNTCSRGEPGGPAMCTLRACIGGTEGQAFCTAYFATGDNKPPVVSSFSGPTTLAVGAIGEWRIDASDPENGPLEYSILWGDEALGTTVMNTSSSEASFTQTTTFTHSYSTAGTYTVRITVRDQYGLSANASATVKVGSDPIACTYEYTPVCGNPPGCKSCSEMGYGQGPCPAICLPKDPQTYGNRCMLNAAGATFLYEGTCRTTSQPIACTMDAKQCPDGSWVGRTGPNCEFVCPTTNSGLFTCPNDPYCMCDAAGRTVLCQ